MLPSLDAAHDYETMSGNVAGNRARGNFRPQTLHHDPLLDT